MSYSICLATTGAGLWTSHDEGKTWLLGHCDHPRYPYEASVRALAVSVGTPSVVWASIDSEQAHDVIARSADRGETYEYLGIPAPGRQVWSVAVDPLDPNTIVAGSRPGGVFRSNDGGRSWIELPTGIAASCSIGSTRVTSVRYTDVPGELWASVEIDGLYHSLDGGDSWQQHHASGGEKLLGEGEVWKDERHFDIHDVVAGRDAEGQSNVFVATPIGFFASSDGGQNWRGSRYPIDAQFEASLFYTRSLYVPADETSTVLVGLGRRPPDHGSLGGIQRSTDGGLTWRPVSPVLRSVVWRIAGHPHEPRIVVAVTLFGQVLLSADAGNSWQPVDREFGEIRGVAIAAG
jgi:photosystem II stability/assembly factor-like uncharacterized protein